MKEILLKNSDLGAYNSDYGVLGAYNSDYGCCLVPRFLKVTVKYFGSTF